MTTGLRRRWLTALPASRGLAALIGALTVIGGIAGPVQAQTVDCIGNPATPFVNCNPGGTVIVTNSHTQSLTFAPPTTNTNSISQYQTEIVGLSNGMSVYDMTFAAAFGTPGVSSGIGAAEAALLSRGDIVTGPFLVSSFATHQSVSAILYALDPAVPVQTSSSTINFGPGVINATVPVGDAGGTEGINIAGNLANPNVGFYSSCGLSSLPSSTLPVCQAVNGGTVTILAGQTDINIGIDLAYLINTTNTTTDTTTITAVYDVIGLSPSAVPEPATWAMLLAGFGGIGIAARARRFSKSVAVWFSSEGGQDGLQI